MSKKILLCLIILFASVITNSAGELVKVVKIDLSNPEKANQVEELNLKVLDINDNYLITVVSSEVQTKLESSLIQYQTISNQIDIGELFLISANNKSKQDLSKISNRTFYKSDALMLVRNPGIKITDKANIVALPVNKTRRTFKNEKMHYSSTELNDLDNLINSVITNINAESVESYIQGLQDFGTRYLGNVNRKEVALWIKNKFELMGYTDVKLDSFMVSGLWQYNVVTTYPASNGSDEVVVVGGHHDSITSASFSDPNAPAPGADDNASGTTAVLEIAKALKEANYESEVKIKFVTFAAEELGLYGGFDYAEKAADSGMDIKFMINHDMISNSPMSLEESTVDINYYTGSDFVRELALQNVQKYTGIAS